MMPVNLRFYQLSHVLSVYQSWHCPTDANCQEQLDHLLWISILSYLIPPVARNLDGEVSTCTSVGCRTGEEGLTSEDDVITEARNWPQSQVASPAAQLDSPGRRWGEGGARLCADTFLIFSGLFVKELSQAPAKTPNQILPGEPKKLSDCELTWPEKVL